MKRESAPSKRRGRPPAGEATLSRARIVEAAIVLVERHGIEAATMRGVARALRVDSMSLYNHVTDRDDLVDAITEHVLARMVIPAPTGSLRRDVRAIAAAFRTATLAYPRCASLVMTRQVGSHASLGPVDATLAVCRRAGFSPDRAVHAVRTLLAYLVGSMLRETDASPAFSGTDVHAVAARREALKASQRPAVAWAAKPLASCDHARELDFGLELLITALEREVTSSARQTAGPHRRRAR